MKMDLTCPVELWKCELPGKEYPACALRLYNLTDQLVVSVEVTLLLLDTNGEEQTRVLYRAHDLHGEPGKTFRMAVPVQSGSAAPASGEVVFEKVWFENGTVWRRARGSSLSFVSNALPHGRELDMLHLVAGDTAVGYPEEQENGWLCVCGRPNPLDSAGCIRCHRSRIDVFEHFNRAAVEKEVANRQAQLDAKARKTLEDASRRQAERAEKDEQTRRKRRRVIAGVATVAVLGGAAYAGVFHVKPYLDYQSAVTAYQAGRWAEAQTAFAAMEDYRDAADYVLRCRYAQANDLLDRAGAPMLQSAEDAFTALGDYQDSAAKALQARAKRAGVLLDGSRLVEARELYASLPGEENAAQVTWCDYLLAADQLKNGDFAAAMQAFAALGDYRDAPEQLTQATLGRARAMLSQTDAAAPDEVLALLDQLPADHAEAAQLRAQAWYRKAQVLRADGDHEAAYEAYLNAGSYQDAAEQAKQTLYEPACAAQEAGRLVEAGQLFARIPGYQDADDRVLQCLYPQAVAALDDLEYKLAASLLDQLPDDYQDVADLRREVIYRPAAAAMGKKDYAAAIAGFEQLGDYKDSAKQLAKARYALAGSLESADPDAAMTLYEQLGDYQESAKKLRALRYSTAVQAQADGDHDRAEALFTVLGAYRDCPARISAIHYARAEALLADGKPDEAIAAFEALGKYQDSADRADQIRYSLAEALLADGKPDEAIAAFETLGKYQDSAERADQIRYSLAEALLADGKPDEAIAAFEAIGKFKDSAERADQIRYSLAEALLADGKPDEAIAAFEALGKYQDSAERADQIRYDQAELMQAGGDLEHALALFTQLGSYQDSADHVQQIRYAQAAALADAGDYDAAAEAFAALGSYKDAAAQIKAVRYRQAEALLNDGDAEAALEVFAALGHYEDAADRIRQIRYDQAATLAASAHYAEAEAAYAALGNFADSADRVLKMRYCQAEELLSAGAWEEAKAAFAALGDYSDASQRVMDCDLLHARQLSEAGRDAEAEELLLSLGNYAGADAELKALYYRRGQAAEAEGRLEEAASLYLMAIGHADAKARADACMQVFSRPYINAKAAMEAGQPDQALAALLTVDLTAVPPQFADMLPLCADAAAQCSDRFMAAGKAAQAAALLEQLPKPAAALIPDFAQRYADACMAEARRLLDQRKEEAALPYLLRVRTEESIALLHDRGDALLLGAWQAEDLSLVFHPDGACLINGEPRFYRLDSYVLSIGPAADQLTVTYKIATAPTDILQLRDVSRGGSVPVTLVWVGPCELPPLP